MPGVLNRQAVLCRNTERRTRPGPLRPHLPLHLQPRLMGKPDLPDRSRRISLRVYNPGYLLAIIYNKKLAIYIRFTIIVYLFRNKNTWTTMKYTMKYHFSHHWYIRGA